MGPLTPDRWERAQQTFEAALALPPADRAAFVSTQLADDSQLATQVDRMLAAHESTGPLDRLAVAVNALSFTPRATPSEPATDEAATDGAAVRLRVGAWRIEALLGRGGMGSVYLAQRDDGQYEQRAAVKFLRHDVADPDVHRRFLAERRILGRLEHPAIARILDGGITDEGRPWFALEYVDGQPIDAWCATRQLRARERLLLFRQVCEAVQHAHGLLVVHRDIKPANVLVTHDGRVKLLDFGIARLLDPAAFADDTDGTRTGAILLTPSYASPEQLRGEPAGTASDVFQLGILLFQLLAGQPPQRDDARRSPESGAVRQRPSAVAAPAMQREIDRDLDTIVLAATQPDPNRRYPSADRLSEDVQRWLDGRPILARPDTIGYRAGRFIRRNAAAVVLTATLAVSLVTFATVSAMQARRVERERDRARQVITFVTELFQMANPRLTGGTPVTAREVIDRGADRLRAEVRDPLLMAELLGVLSDTYSALGESDRAFDYRVESLDLLGSGKADPLLLAETHRNLANLLASASRPDSALPHIAEAVRILRRRAPRSEALLRALGDHAFVHMVRGDEAAAEPFFQQAVDLYERVPGINPLRLAPILTNRGWSAQARGDLEQAEALMRESLALRRAGLPPGDVQLLGSLRSLAGVLVHAKKFEAADSASSENFDIVTRTFTPPHPDIAGALGLHARVRSGLRDAAADSLFAVAMEQTRQVYGATSLPAADLANQFGWHLVGRDDFEQAARYFAESAATFGAIRGPRHVSALITAGNHAWTIWQTGRLAEADSIMHLVIEGMTNVWPDGDSRLAGRLSDHGAILSQLGRHADAETLLRRALAMQLERLPDDAPDLISLRIRLGECLAAQQRFADAEPFYHAAHNVLITRDADDPTTRRHIDRIIAFYGDWGRPLEAARFATMRSDSGAVRTPSAPRH